MKQLVRVLPAVLVLLMAGCYPIDSGIAWQGGPYRLGWIDEPQAVTLDFARDGERVAGRIDSVVYAVGWDGRYLVAKQHPDGNRAVTHYFVIDSTNDHLAASPARVVTGPLSETEFRHLSKKLGLPVFSTTLAALE